MNQQELNFEIIKYVNKSYILDYKDFFMGALFIWLAYFFEPLALKIYFGFLGAVYFLVIVFYFLFITNEQIWDRKQKNINRIKKNI